MSFRVVGEITCDGCSEIFTAPYTTTQPHNEVRAQAEEKGWRNSGHTGKDYCCLDCAKKSMWNPRRGIVRT